MKQVKVMIDDWKYGPFVIWFEYPPIPDRRYDYCAGIDDDGERGNIANGRTLNECIAMLHEDIEAGEFDDYPEIEQLAQMPPHPGHPYPYGDLTWTFKIGDEPYEANLSGDTWIVYDRNDNAVRDERIIAAAKHSLETGISYIQAREVAA